MSFFKGMFGGKGEEKITTSDAIQRLRDTEEMLYKKQDYLEKQIQKELVTAKQNGVKNKRAAIQALKRKKRFEKQLQQIDGTLSTIEMQRETLEAANTNTSVLKVMNDAAKALKTAHQDMDIDKVQDMMDNIAEQQEVAREINEAISQPAAFTDDIDEDDLLAELEELEQEALDEKLLDTSSVPSSLPDVPEALPQIPTQKKKVEEDDDMAELAAWAS